ncbi:hypothetical protein [Streptomyces sp. AP-93]|uniref:hypothetical protein n=1 Tax=Streptomyces sp. AP-93 TaxID=2929048 RepID=UPI001FAF4C09|nr:hypothetical protein [Streptomyces sp. AP-93]MCJ0869147.1 hypothetical protein [Streptomyces sp. AP-93]
MSGDGADLSVSKQALGEIAKGITDTLGELKELGMVGTASMGRGFSDLGLSGMETGHEGLTASMKTFCERWEWGVRSLVQQGNQFAFDVGLSAGVLHEQDQYIQGSFKVLTNSAMGNPYASEKDVIGQDWGAVISDNPYTQVRDADYSRESFDRANENSREAWTGAVRDVNSSDMLLGNQIINAAGLRDEVDGAVDAWVGPAPQEQPQSEGER